MPEQKNITTGELTAAPRVSSDDKPIFEVVYLDGRRYRIFADGRIEGFPDGAIISNGILAWVNLAKGLAIQARNNGLISAEEAANILS
ncbi:MAG: hypothetical protein Q8L80_07930 [Gallionella sp.]|nr:hypothetical protein [Gallionella sp.]MDP1941261.1 hypothetical protein [Gallionella sp.]